MSVAKVVEISATSPKGFEDAMQEGIKRASETIRHIRSAWVKEQEAEIEGNRIVKFKVNMMVTFVLDEDAAKGT